MIFELCFCFCLVWTEKLLAPDRVKFVSINIISYFLVITLFSVYLFSFNLFCWSLFLMTSYFFLINFNLSSSLISTSSDFFFLPELLLHIKCSRNLFRFVPNHYACYIFVKIGNDWKPLNIFAKSFILDIWLGSRYVSERSPKLSY